MADKFTTDVACSVLAFAIGVGVGIEHSLLTAQIEADKKQICIQAYRENSASVLADSFCDDYFKVMRESK